MPRDRKALALYTAHRGELVNVANRILGDRAHAEDVVQEAYLRFDTAARDRAVAEPLAYFYRIVRNLALDTRRRLGRERTRQAAGGDESAGELAADAPSPEAETAGREELRAMMRALDELPTRTRIALEMHRFGGRPFTEIAAHLGISVGLAHLLVVQGLEHCRERLYGR